VKTPDAQMLIPLSFSLHWFSTAEHNIWKKAIQVNTPTTYYQMQTYNPVFYSFDKFLILNNWNINFKKQHFYPIIDHPDFTVTSIKKAEHTDDILIRGFNNSDKSIHVKFHNELGQPVLVDNLDLSEKLLKSSLDKDTITKYQIKTYKIHK
jgi:alpha-mannosidase